MLRGLLGRWGWWVGGCGCYVLWVGLEGVLHTQDDALHVEGLLGGWEWLMGGCYILWVGLEGVLHTQGDALHVDGVVGWARVMGGCYILWVGLEGVVHTQGDALHVEGLLGEGNGWVLRTLSWAGRCSPHPGWRPPCWGVGGWGWLMGGCYVLWVGLEGVVHTQGDAPHVEGLLGEGNGWVLCTLSWAGRCSPHPGWRPPCWGVLGWARVMGVLRTLS